MNRSRAEDTATEVFGLDGGDDTLYRSINLFVLGVGGILAIFGTTTKNKRMDVVIRAAAGAGAGLALVNLLKGAFTPYTPPCAKEGGCVELPSKEEPTKQGLGSEWSPEDDPTYDYVNRFYYAIDTTRRLPWAARMPQSRLFTSRR
jgi:hypothetical protein